jgi:ankyrin repeat protein
MVPTDAAQQYVDLARQCDWDALLERLRAADAGAAENATADTTGLDFTDADGRTALHWAVSMSAKDERANLAAQELLKALRGAAQGARVCRMSDGSGLTPLHSACATGNRDLVAGILDLLEEEDGEASDPSDDARRARRKEAANTATRARRTPLHYACSRAATAVVGVLLDAGASVSARDNYGATPLHRAAGCAAEGTNAAVIETVKLLLKAGANGDAVDRAGDTAFHIACMEHSTALAKYLLLEAKVDNGVQNEDGKYALQLAPHDMQDVLIPIVKELRGK